MISGYSFLHFLTDGLCAYAMFAKFAFSSDWYLYMLIYNFCAFALQMPLGALMDMADQRFIKTKEYIPLVCSVTGVLLTIIGALTNPVILGIGNALFHVGGGIDTMKEDRRRDKRGALLGIFVSPGAIGLFLGTYAGKNGFFFNYYTGLLIISLAMILFSAGLIILVITKGKKGTIEIQKRDEGSPKKIIANSEINKKHFPNMIYTTAAVAFLVFVVVIRSYTGMNVSFSWKTGFIYGFISVLMVAFGKAMGGIMSAFFGMKKVMLISLTLSAVMYYYSDIPVCGLLALLTFNMTMPMTLYLLADRFKDYPGTSFGILTMALFVGFLPAWMKLPPLFKGNILGMIMSLISLIVLFISYGLIKKGAKND